MTHGIIKILQRYVPVVFFYCANLFTKNTFSPVFHLLRTYSEGTARKQQASMMLSSSITS